MDFRLSLIKLRYWLFILLIIGAPLSRYPSLGTPIYNFSSFRFGLYQLVAAFFVLLCIWPTIKRLPAMLRQNKVALTSLCILAILVATSLFKSLFFARSLLLVASILFLLLLVLVSWWYVKYELKKISYPVILRYILYAGVVYSVLALAQFLLATFTNENLGILCKGCNANIFGFPRINVFAAEPQFFANALLPFFFVSFALFYKNKSQLSIVSLTLTTIAITLTFSRGAFFACFIGVVFYIIGLFLYKKQSIKRLSIGLSIVVVCSLISFLLLIGSASVRYNSTPNITYNTLQSTLEHLSLGVIKLPEKTQPIIKTTATNITQPFISPGLIESSTNDRLGASELALKAWNTNILTTLTGVGSGNLGPYVVKNIDPLAPNNLTVYIFYVLLLAELGLLGLVAFIVFYANNIGWFLKKLAVGSTLPIYLSIAAINIAFITQYLFFGTFINTVYVWLWAGITLGLSGMRTRKKI